LYVLFLEVGEGDVVAVQEAEPCVIVLEIERLSQSLRVLVDKAEHTAIAAGLFLFYYILKGRFIFHTDSISYFSKMDKWCKGKNFFVKLSLNLE